MEHAEYVTSEVKVVDVTISKAIAQSYGEPGKPGGPMDEKEMTGW